MTCGHLSQNTIFSNEFGSDHLAITFNTDLGQTQTTGLAKNAQKLNLNKTDVEKVKQHIHDYIHSQLEICSNENIQEQFISAIEKFSPHLMNIFYQHTLPIYILRLIKRKRELYRLYTQTNDD